MPVTNNPSYCADLVRRLDRERYLCALFAPAAAREDLLALYAFNLELARIPELVREQILAGGRRRKQRAQIAFAVETADQIGTITRVIFYRHAGARNGGEGEIPLLR